MSLHGHSVTWKTMKVDAQASSAVRLFGSVVRRS